MFETAWTTEAYEHACQDKVAIFAETDRCVIVVADGAGGTGSGGKAAAAVVDAVRLSAETTDTSAGWSGVLRQIDAQIGPGQSTAVVVDVKSDRICGASAGDSQAWVVKGADIADLTLHQRRKPLLGSGEAEPVGFTYGPLDGLLLVATDGFCNYVKRTEIVKIIPYDDFATLPKRLISLVRLRSGGLNDDVGIVVCRCQRPVLDRKAMCNLDLKDNA
jgi:serine/threonine protein phosphatase PrpC